MKKPIKVSTFRGPDPHAAGTANVGDTTLRFEDADGVIFDIKIPSTTPEVFSGLREKEGEFELLVNSVEDEESEEG